MLLRTFAASAAILALAAPAAARVADAKAERASAGVVTVTWSSPNPVDVYVAPSPEALAPKGAPAADGSRAGRLEIPAAGARPYVLLRDTVDGTWVKVAERVLPLEQGSNFRDIGGYPAGGKHVKWGMIFRSGGTPMLTDPDLAQIGALKLSEMVDLRSSEERILAPSRIAGVRYTAVGYSMMQVMPVNGIPTGPADLGAAYRRFPTLLTPQLRILFADLLEGAGPIAYNCSAGQDRTGFATGLILAALGVPRETIYADYVLSTTYRRPEWEMPKIDAAMAASSPTAAFFAQAQKTPAYAKPFPLVTPEQKPLLAFAFDEIEAKYGSVDAYLEKELGVTAADRAKLRAMYLE